MGMKNPAVKLIQIRWTFYQDGYEEGEVIKEKAWTCGYLVNETADEITLSQGWSVRGGVTTGLVTFPKSMIENIEEIKFD